MSRLAVFGGLSDEEIQLVTRSLKERRYVAGQDIVKEGEPGSEMFVVAVGAVNVFAKTQGGGERVIARLGPGQCFGEMCLIEAAPRSATVRAIEQTLALSLTARDLDAIRRTSLKTFTMIIMNLARELSRRLRRADQLLSDFSVAVRR